MHCVLSALTSNPSNDGPVYVMCRHCPLIRPRCIALLPAKRQVIATVRTLKSRLSVISLFYAKILAKLVTFLLYHPVFKIISIASFTQMARRLNRVCRCLVANTRLMHYSFRFTKLPSKNLHEGADQFWWHFIHMMGDSYSSTERKITYANMEASHKNTSLG